MPLYEYQCRSCGERFEVMQKFSDSPLETHERCGGAVERLLSAPALQFKGSGWYVTDYARSNGKEAKAKDGAAESKDTGSKTESKPATSTKSDSSPAATNS